MTRPRSAFDLKRERKREGNRRWWQKNKAEYINIALLITRTEHSELIASAKRQDVRMADLIRQYITWGLENDAAGPKAIDP